MRNYRMYLSVLTMLAWIAVTAQGAAAADKKSGLRTDVPVCGYESVYKIPPDEVVEIMYRTPEKFQACKRNSDCVVVESYCGTQKAVNKDSQQCFAAVAELFDSSARCVDKKPFDATAVCRRKTCTLMFGDTHAQERKGNK